jgi:photosystem II stability/assembly factor-like uncharacterized protein
MRFAWICLVSWIAPWLAHGQTWELQSSGVTASLRGVQAVNGQVVWASGTQGTWLHTTDGGAAWTSGKVPGAGNLDFRGLHAVDGATVYLMSIGPGEQSRVYKTSDSGAHWQRLFTNPDARHKKRTNREYVAKMSLLAGPAIGFHNSQDSEKGWRHQDRKDALLCSSHADL